MRLQVCMKRDHRCVMTYSTAYLMSGRDFSELHCLPCVEEGTAHGTQCGVCQLGVTVRQDEVRVLGKCPQGGRKLFREPNVVHIGHENDVTGCGLNALFDILNKSYIQIR